MAVMFQNAQWEVTKDTLRCKPPEAKYEIYDDRITETTTRNGIKYYDFPVHMAEKSWVNVAAFNEAFVAALELWKGKFPPVDDAMLEATINYAVKVGNKRNE